MLRVPRRAGWAARTGVLALTGALALLGGPALAGPAVAGYQARPVAIAPDRCAEPGQPVKEVPWAQGMLRPERVWPFTTGAGTTVAILSSGVDAGHPQLRGRVAAGLDAAAGSGRADDDCLGLGTQVAGVLAARSTDDQGFAGVAPGTRILPVRILDDAGFGTPQVDPKVLARGIGWAIDQGAAVIVVPIPVYVDDTAVRTAVARAVGAGVVVVAAAGDGGVADGPGPTPYPAAYDGVLGVGAIGPTGLRPESSPRAGYVDLVAPGEQILTLATGGGLTAGSGTALASGFVGAAAVLVRSKRGAAEPGQIERYLLGTAVPAPAGPGFGRGIVNPYGAVNDHLAAAAPGELPTLVRVDQPTDTAWLRSRNIAVVGALVVGAVLLAVWAGAMALPRARRRSWRAAAAAPAPRGDQPTEPGPPLQLFDEQRTTGT